MNYNILAIFNDSQLKEIEEIALCTLMTQGMKNQLVKAVEDYRYLLSSLFAARGLSQQVILFLLNPDSCTVVGVDEFLEKLECWVMILEDEDEQRKYADVLRYSYYDEDELLTLRFTLIDILKELEETKIKTLKKSKNSQDILVKNKIPMQLDNGFPDYSSWMMEYGSEFDEDSSCFNIVPDLKRHPSQTEICDAFAVYCEQWEVPTLQK